MKRCVAILLALFLIGAAKSTAPHFPQRLADGSLLYRFGDAWPVIDCPMNDTCQAEFGANEVPKGPPVLGDPSGVWQAEISGSAPSILSIHPLKVGHFTNVTVRMRSTDGSVDRTYVVFIRSVTASDDTTGLLVRWEMPPTPPPRVVYVPTLVTPTPKPTPRSAIDGVNLAALNCGEYHVSHVYADAPFKPTQVCSDGIRTYIHIPDGPVPSIAMFDHGLGLVNWKFEHGWFIVEGHANGYALIRILDTTREEVDLVRQ